MDALGNIIISTVSDPNETQATQLLDELLNNEQSTNVKFSADTTSKSYILKSQQALQHDDISTDSIPSSRTNNSAPHYHLHGLASTQSQSHLQEGEEVAPEGSQKENIRTMRSGKELGKSSSSPVSRSNSPQRIPKTSKIVPAKGKKKEAIGTGKGGNNRNAARTINTFEPPSSKNEDNVTFDGPATRQSPDKRGMKPPSSRYKLPSRPSSPALSQDSFANDPDQDLEEAFVAGQKHFQISLSELARASPSIHEQEGVIAGDASHPPMYRGAYRNVRKRLPTPPQGNVLVEDSDLDNSQPHGAISEELSQRFEETQLSEDPQDGNQKHAKQDFGPETQPASYDSNSSGYTAFLRGDEQPSRRANLQEDSRIVETQPSTQPEEIEATQPASESGDIYAPRSGNSKDPNAFFDWDDPALRQAPSTTGGTDPRSLLSMVPPHARSRYKHINQGSGGDFSIYQQQNEVPRATTSRYPMQESGVSGPSHQTRNTGMQNNPIRRSNVQYSMDNVPDSEPHRYRSFPLPEGNNAKARVVVLSPHKDFGKRLKGVAENEDVEMNSSVEEGGQESDDDDDDIPLAATKRQMSSSEGANGRELVDKRKGKVVDKQLGHLSRKTPDTVNATPASEDKTQPTPLKPRKNRRANRSWETTIVPSSIPEEDQRTHHPVNTGRVTRSGTTQATEGKASDTHPKANVSKPQTRASAKRTKTRECEADANHAVPPDEPLQGVVGSSSRKRKMGTPAGTAKTPVGAKRTKREVNTSQIRGTTATMEQALPATRVFALYAPDAHFYSGVVRSLQNSTYSIEFDDHKTAVLPIELMRRCELIVGDDVLYGDRTAPVKVIAVPDGPDGNVTITADGKKIVMSISDLRIASRTVTHAWKDRMLDPQSVIPLMPTPPLARSPTGTVSDIQDNPQNQSSTSLFAGVGLIITLSITGKSIYKKAQSKISSAVSSARGTVVNIPTIIQFNGRHTEGNRSYILEKGDARWIGNSMIERIFLLADEPNQKPKYLIALALGIPCLSTAWLEDSVIENKEKEWQQYMLHQGFSAYLGGRLSQQVDCDWGNSIHHVQDIMSNRFPSKLFSGMNILCIVPTMVCLPRGKKDESLDAVPQIILCMGAESVECVVESRNARRRFSDYNYIVIRQEGAHKPEFKVTKTVDWAWVKDCLISSRIVPLPPWPNQDVDSGVDFEYSQEA